MFVHIKKTHKRNVSEVSLWVVCFSFLHFLKTFFLSSFPTTFSYEFSCSDVHMVESYATFSGFVYRVDHTSFKLTKHIPYLLSTDFLRL